jgi:glyoxylase-like metal-dependent hydrolase (beta-lactamase superfamily II)
MVSKVSFIESGYCKQFEYFVNPVQGSFKPIRFPATVAVIEHEKKGLVLFDTGYSMHSVQATRKFPERFYDLLVPITITPETTALSKIKKMGYQARDIRHVILSHFHGDHIGGIRDFPDAQFTFYQKDYETFKSYSRLKQISHAFIEKLIPEDFHQRMNAVNFFNSRVPELGDDWFGHDLFDDGSLTLIPLTGHSSGHCGLFIRTQDSKKYFLLGDAAWQTQALQEGIPPSKFTRFIFSDSNEYQETFLKLHRTLSHCQKTNSTISFIPCHCYPTLTQAGLS